MAADGAKRPQEEASDSESSDDDDKDEVGAEPKKPLSESLLKYVFVDEPISDEEFAAYRGLDARRLVQYKRKVQAMIEKEKRSNLRERERRTVLRKLKKAEGADAGAEVMDFDSDEEM